MGRLTSCCSDKWWLASPPRRAEQQIAVASDGGALTRVSPRRPSISPLLPPHSSSEGNASELLEITLMERAKWQSAHSSTLIWNSLYQQMYLFVYFFHPKVKKEHHFIFFFFFFQSALCSDSRPSRHTLIHLKACAQRWERWNNKLAALMAFSLNNLALGCRFFKIYTR